MGSKAETIRNLRALSGDRAKWRRETGYGWHPRAVATVRGVFLTASLLDGGMVGSVRADGDLLAESQTANGEDAAEMLRAALRRVDALRAALLAALGRESESDR